MEDLHDPACLDAAGFPDGLGGMVRPADDRIKRIEHYLTSPVVFSGGRELTWVDVASERAHLRTLQRHLRGQVAGRGIVVEVNPSSNLLIGNLADLESHPFWRFSPPVKRDGAPPPVGVCIGSDDPITFSTTLRHEYQLVCDALTAAGLGDAALGWLDDVRKTALNARFTLGWATALQRTSRANTSSDDVM